MSEASKPQLDLLLAGGTVLTLADGSGAAEPSWSVGIVGDRIAVVGPAAELAAQWSAQDIIDCTGQAILPGFVDAHLHTCQSLVRGLADDIPVLEWLTRVVNLEAAMDEDDVYASVRLACLEMIRGGTTAFIEACANPTYVDAVADAVIDSGLRAALTRSSMEHQEPDWEAPAAFLADGPANVEATRRLIERWNGAGNGRIAAWCGWRQQWNLSDDTIVALARLSQDHGVGFHGHLSTRRSGQIESLEALGVLGPQFVFAHAIRFTDRDMDLIEQYDVKINHNPGASMHGAYGSAVAGRFPELIDRGVNVCLGCDGAANGNTLDMWQTTRLAATLHKEVRQDATVVPAPQALQLSTVNGGRALQRDDLGVVAVGMKADLQVIDLQQAHLTPAHDVANVLVYCASGQDVVATVVDGRILMRDGQVTSLDERRVLEDAEARARRLAPLVLESHAREVQA